MSLILCRQEPVKHPFYFECLGVRLFSSQELCYAIYNNPLLVMEGFVDNSLIEFIQDDLDMAFLALKLLKWQQSGEDGDEPLAVILHECDYYNAAEVSRFKQKLAAYRRMPEAEFLKERADYLFSRKQYGKAVTEYQKILDLPKVNRVDEMFQAKIYNNLGASYARLFMTDKAYQAYQKSFDLVKSGEVLKRICHLAQWNTGLVLNERFQALITEELKQESEKDRKKAEEIAGEADSLLELENLFQKDPIKRFHGAGELVQKWKQEYRNIMS
jgi:tetratricopeptide (TPR) repeat protein